MSLGCNELTDDQLLEILQETCDELASRSGLVRDYAQKLIISGAEKAQIQERVLDNMLKSARLEYTEKLTKEVKEDLRQMVARGEVRLLDSATEANLSLEAERKAFLELLEEAKRNMAQTGEFRFSIRGPQVTITFGPRTVTVNHNLNPQQVADLSNYIASITGV